MGSPSPLLSSPLVSLVSSLSSHLYRLVSLVSSLSSRLSRLVSLISSLSRLSLVCPSRLLSRLSSCHLSSCPYLPPRWCSSFPHLPSPISLPPSSILSHCLTSSAPFVVILVSCVAVSHPSRQSLSPYPTRHTVSPISSVSCCLPCFPHSPLLYHCSSCHDSPISRLLRLTYHTASLASHLSLVTLALPSPCPAYAPAFFVCFPSCSVLNRYNVPCISCMYHINPS